MPIGPCARAAERASYFPISLPLSRLASWSSYKKSGQARARLYRKMKEAFGRSLFSSILSGLLDRRAASSGSPETGMYRKMERAALVFFLHLVFSHSLFRLWFHFSLPRTRPSSVLSPSLSPLFLLCLSRDTYI